MKLNYKNNATPLRLKLPKQYFALTQAQAHIHLEPEGRLLND